MRRIRAIGGVVGLLVVGSLGVGTGLVEGAVRIVPTGYPTIQAAIAAAGAGDTIWVQPDNPDPLSTADVYLACLTISKKVILVAGGDVTIHCTRLDNGSNDNHAVYLTAGASGSRVQGFAGLIADDGMGVFIAGSTTNQILTNWVSSRDASDCDTLSDQFSDRHAIEITGTTVGSGSSLHPVPATGNVVAGNTILEAAPNSFDCERAGIRVEKKGDIKNVLTNNVISSALVGDGIETLANSGTISFNVILDVASEGLELDTDDGGGNLNNVLANVVLGSGSGDESDILFEGASITGTLNMDTNVFETCEDEGSGLQCP